MRSKSHGRFVKVRLSFLADVIPPEPRAAFLVALAKQTDDGTTVFSREDVRACTGMGLRRAGRAIEWLCSNPENEETHLTKMEATFWGYRYKIRRAEWAGKSAENDTEIGLEVVPFCTPLDKNVQGQNGQGGCPKRNGGVSKTERGGVQNGTDNYRSLQILKDTTDATAPEEKPKATPPKKQSLASSITDNVLDLWKQSASTWRTPPRTGGKAWQRGLKSYVENQADANRVIEALTKLTTHRPKRFHTDNERPYWSLAWLFRKTDSKHNPVDHIQEIIDGTLLEQGNAPASPRSTLCDRCHTSPCVCRMIEEENKLRGTQPHS